MSENKLIKASIIMPVYNSAKYLEKTLECILNQTFKDFELIIIDNESTDNSLDVVKKIDDERVKILSSPKEQGAGGARNKGLEAAGGEVVIFLDSDDEFSPFLIEKMYNKYKETDADIVVSGYEMDFEKENRKSIVPMKLKSEMKNEIVGNIKKIDFYPLFYPPFVWNKMYKHEFIQKNNLQFSTTKASNDIMFAILSLCFAKNISTVEDILIFYKRRDESISSKRSAQNFSEDKIYGEIRRKLKRGGIFKKYEYFYYNLLLYSYQDLFHEFKDKRDYLKVCKKIKKTIPFLFPSMIYNKPLYRKFILVKMLPCKLSYLYFCLMQKKRLKFF